MGRFTSRRSFGEPAMRRRPWVTKLFLKGDRTKFRLHCSFKSRRSWATKAAARASTLHPLPEPSARVRLVASTPENWLCRKRQKLPRRRLTNPMILFEAFSISKARPWAGTRRVSDGGTFGSCECSPRIRLREFDCRMLAMRAASCFNTENDSPTVLSASPAPQNTEPRLAGVLRTKPRWLRARVVIPKPTL